MLVTERKDANMDDKLVTILNEMSEYNKVSYGRQVQRFRRAGRDRLYRHATHKDQLKPAIE